MPVTQVSTLNENEAVVKLRSKSSVPESSPEPRTLYDKQELEGRHFSSLLFSGDVVSTAIEFGSRFGLIALGALNPGGYFTPSEGSQTLVEIGLWMLAMSVFSRSYNAWLEYVYFTKPQYRTQPPLEHALREKCDLTGRELKDLRAQMWHDRTTLVLDALLALTVYLLVPGFYPAAGVKTRSWPVRLALVLAHQYCLSFTMYWAHRAGHVVPWKWKNIHGVHHQATHPLSRNTYQAHAFDNFMNAIYGHTFAQLLIPLDFTGYYLIHFLRIMESLEKHSGVSCYYNVAHNLQRLLPFSQMPHHHDLHHEGSKRCNFTFSAAGGLWDAVFGSRKAGRAQFIGAQATALDVELIEKEEAERKEKEAALALVAADAAEGKITLAQLAAHQSPESTWIAIGGTVYDVTTYADKHPGGKQVLAEVAGRDATKAFDDVGHTAKARIILKSLKVGELAGAQVSGPKLDEDSFWNGHITVHLPIMGMIGLVALMGSPGCLPLCAFCATALAIETTICHFAQV